MPKITMKIDALELYPLQLGLKLQRYPLKYIEKGFRAISITTRIETTHS